MIPMQPSKHNSALSLSTYMIQNKGTVIILVFGHNTERDTAVRIRIGIVASIQRVKGVNKRHREMLNLVLNCLL